MYWSATIWSCGTQFICKSLTCKHKRQQCLAFYLLVHRLLFNFYDDYVAFVRFLLRFLDRTHHKRMMLCHAFAHLVSLIWYSNDLRKLHYVSTLPFTFLSIHNNRILCTDTVHLQINVNAPYSWKNKKMVPLQKSHSVILIQLF